jgi:hypothetical protein
VERDRAPPADLAAVVRASARVADLVGTDFAAADLVGTDFAAAGLAAADFMVTDFMGTDFMVTDLAVTDLAVTDLVTAGRAAAGLAVAGLTRWLARALAVAARWARDGGAGRPLRGGMSCGVSTRKALGHSGASAQWLQSGRLAWHMRRPCQIRRCAKIDH